MASLPPRQTSNFNTQINSTAASGNRKSASLLLPQLSPPNRVTRSSARLAADPQSQNSTTPAEGPHSIPKPSNPSRKRKAPSGQDINSGVDDPDTSPSWSIKRQSKRQKTTSTESPVAQQTSTTPSSRPVRNKKPAPDTAMSNNGSVSKNIDDSIKQGTSKNQPKRGSSRTNKKPLQDSSPPSQTLPSRKVKKRLSKKDTDVEMKDDDAEAKSTKREKETTPPPPPVYSDSNEGMSPDASRDEDQDPFASALFGRGGPAGLSSTLRALSGMMSGMSSRLREMLNNLRRVDDPSIQMIALEELSNLLLVSNEDNLSGQFSPDPYVKELVTLMQPNPITGEENPEMMLLACRCIANLMEALRGSVANVVYGGAVPVLCQKLLDIQYIDVAEQALSTLSKVSLDFPASIVREGGLTACLQFLDFFATGTQRTAVTTAANCCRNIPHDSFPVIRDVMPILQNVLVSHDQKVVEQGCLCVTRIIDSFKHSSEKLEKLVDPPLLRAILGLLLPGTTNLIGSNIHTEFLRVLAIVARNSPRLSTELVKMNVVDTLYQILTGVSPPSETSDAASKIDSVVIMQALIHRPREQIYEALNVICELLPKVSSQNGAEYDMNDNSLSEESISSQGTPSKTQKRLELLKDCKQETRRFAMILLPTLTDAYSSTVNLNVRQKVLTAQLKILSNLETEVIEEALRPVPYASFLASILSQEDHLSLVMFALQASELLFERLEDIYQYQFHREGVIGEIQKLASRAPAIDVKASHVNDNSQGSLSGVQGQKADQVNSSSKSGNPGTDSDIDEHRGVGDQGDHDDNDEGDDDDDDDDDDEEDHEDEDEMMVRDAELDDDQSSDSSDEDLPSPLAIAGVKDKVIIRAQKFLEKYDTDKGRELRTRAEKIRDNLRDLADKTSICYQREDVTTEDVDYFTQLAQYFDGDALESITSSELLDSGVIRLLGEILASDAKVVGNPRGDFLAAFMGQTKTAKLKTSTAGSTSTAFSVLIQKLQDLLSRAEHFEVLTVNSNAAENSRNNSTSMLTRQIRLKLTADADSEIPPSYSDMIVSIHAIATFKALDDYLRPRMSISERSSGRRRDMLQQLANARMAQLSGAADSGMFSPFGADLGLPRPPTAKAGETQALPKLTSRSKPEGVASEPADETKSVDKGSRRRSSRKPPTSTSSTSQPTTGLPEPEVPMADDQLECADEKRLDDDVSHEQDPSSDSLDAIVGALEEEAGSEDEAEPGAVNMEIASTGKVTARQEDGTRVFTPLQPGTPVSAARPKSTDRSATIPPNQSQKNQSRPSSYAAALAATPQDWHIEFSIDGKAIPDNTTIYRAVHHNRDQPQEISGRTVWSGIHTVKFRRVKGPPPSSSLYNPEDRYKDNVNGGLPASLDGHPVTSSILSLLGTLHELNASLDDICEALGRAGLTLYAEPLSSFINTKLTAKMNRQLEEPLIVASNCLPDWSEDLARTFPFLFPFETRHLFLQSTSFGYSRSIIRWQNNQSENDDRRDRRRDDRPLMGRPQRQKVRIARAKMLESAMKVMELYGASPSVLEVEYFEEVGTGLGPTLEFYSTVSKEFAKKQLKLWRENDTEAKDQYAFGKNGLFPAPMRSQDSKTEKGQKLLHAFRMLGKFVARSMLDSRIIDINFSPTFFKAGANPPATPSIALLRTVDQDLANSLAQLQQYVNKKLNIEADKNLSLAARASALRNLTIRGAHVEDLALDFTLPGYPSVELCDNGANISVTMDNVDTYIKQVLDLTLASGVHQQIEAFQNGFSQVFSYSSLKAFTYNELVMLFGRVEEDWTIETLMDSIKADHGFNMDSKSVKNLLQVMSELTPGQRRDFLQFVTGSPKLPIGGFKSLTPMFTVVCKPSEPPYSSDDYLPSVMTCVNYLKLPDYSDLDVLKQKLGMAIQEGQGAFHLS